MSNCYCIWNVNRYTRCKWLYVGFSKRQPDSVWFGGVLKYEMKSSKNVWKLVVCELTFYCLPNWWRFCHTFLFGSIYFQENTGWGVLKFKIQLQMHRTDLNLLLKSFDKGDYACPPLWPCSKSQKSLVSLSIHMEPISFGASMTICDPVCRVISIFRGRGASYRSRPFGIALFCRFELL